MPSLGRVLERLHTAWDHLSSAQGTMRFRYQPLRTRRAWERWRDAFPPGSVAEIRGPASSRSELSQGSSAEGECEPYAEHYFRFWMAKPWRWRVEQFSAVNDGPATDPQQVMVIDQARWWTWSADDAVYTNARSAHPEQSRHSGVDQGLIVMLDPAPLTGALRMSVAGSAEQLGRRADILTCTARNPQRDPGLWPGADTYRLLVDREAGVLLRAEALLAEEMYAETAFTELLLNQDVPADRFVFQFPAGAPVHDR